MKNLPLGLLPPGLLLASVLLASPLGAQDRPRVLLIGDSISLGYTALVQKGLADVAEVDRVKGNSGNTARGIKRIDGWLDARHGTWDVIHFNFGLWDLCYRSSESTAQGRRDKKNGEITATLDQYTKNLAKIVARLEQTGAHLIFATTTPVPPGEVGRKVGDDARYNAAALALMAERGVAIDDLHGAVSARMAELQKKPGDVHFGAAGNGVLAAQVCRSIRRALFQRASGKRAKGSKAPAWRPTKKLVYRTVDEVKLSLHCFEPDHHKSSDRRPAIVFFFGGGWVGGSPAQFYPHCAYLASRGMVAISAEYRVKKKHEATPFDCVADGKAAIRWVRDNAAKLGIDPERIAAGGGSAGGHVAAATALTPDLPESGFEDASGSRPDALVLFNPVYDNGPEGYGYKRVKARWRAISPFHNIVKGAPASIVFLGSKDSLIPVKTAEEFARRMRAVGVRSDLHIYKGQPHGFFNYGRGDGSSYDATVAAMDEFLAALGFLQGVATIYTASERRR